MMKDCQFKSESLLIGVYGRLICFRLGFLIRIDGGLIMYRCFDAFRGYCFTLVTPSSAYFNRS